jgi:hypothetical protein
VTDRPTIRSSPPGQSAPQPKRKTAYKYLQDSRVRVLEVGFIGRRRQIQRGVRVLEGFAENGEDVRRGVLIHGVAGVGKSCLAGKLIERFPEKELIVLRGKLSASDLVKKLKEVFDRRGVTSGLAILKSEDLEFEEKIKSLFRTPFKEELPVLFYFDDFEQNLVRFGDSHEVDPDVLPIMVPLLRALDWAEGGANLIVTSRYPFVLEFEGEDLAGKMRSIPLMSFKDADLEKKKPIFPTSPEAPIKSSTCASAAETRVFSNGWT